jgi:DNA-binding MarR family transcriptional regulator
MLTISIADRIAPVDDRDDLPPAMADRLGFLLGRAHIAHRQVAEVALAPLGLAPRQFGALALLADEGPLSQQRLGERMGVDRTTMVALVDGLERGGLVERERNPDDRRAYALRATPRGRSVLGRAAAAVERAEEELLASIPARDARRLKQILRKLIDAATGGS